MRPENGTKMVCINRDGWESAGKLASFIMKLGFDLSSDGPDYGDVVTVEGCTFGHGMRFYKLKEWKKDTYNAECFRPLQPEEEESNAEMEIEKQLTEILSPQKV